MASPACAADDGGAGPCAPAAGIDTATTGGWALALADVLSDGLLALLQTEEAGRLGLASRRCVLVDTCIHACQNSTQTPLVTHISALNTQHTLYVCGRLHDTFLRPKALRASVQAAGPSDGARFRFWAFALRVRAVQREQLVVGEEMDVDTAAGAAFRQALFGQGQGAGGAAYSGKLSLSKEGQVRLSHHLRT